MGEDEETDPNKAKDPDCDEEQGCKEVMEISISALARNPKHKAIRVPGVIKGRKISILNDSGSTQLCR